VAGRTPRQAAENFTRAIERALACITPASIVTTGSDPTAKHGLALDGGKPVPITAADGETAFAVTVLQNYRLVETPDEERGPWRVTTTQYAYTFLDAQGSEVFSYHWHPGIGPRYPHMHIKSTPVKALAKAHFPTGRVSLEEFVRVLLQDLKMRPRRANWKHILQETQAAFVRWRTWT
jgi:hypothetical protein